jgi:hypothetical protein
MMRSARLWAPSRSRTSWSGEKAEDGIDHQADEDLVGLQIGLGLGDQETEALIGVDRLSGDEAQDAVRK